MYEIAHQVVRLVYFVFWRRLTVVPGNSHECLSNWQRKGIRNLRMLL